MEKGDMLLIHKDYLRKFINFEKIPKDQLECIAVMVDMLKKDIAHLSLVRTREHSEFLVNKADMQRLCIQLEEALKYWEERIKPHQFKTTE